jgi:uncharacterized membrane protein
MSAYLNLKESLVFFSPFAAGFIVLFFFFLLFLFIFVQINLIALAFAQIGVPSEYIFIALLAILLGSMFNIPMARVPQDNIVTERSISFFGIRYVLPVWTRRETVVAVNLGGAVIPCLLSVYLLLNTGLWVQALIATAIITFITFRLATPLPGVGIALPAFIPPLLAAVVSLLVAYGHAPIVAYISGTIGTLIGADILRLKEIKHLGAPVASIGGAGTFDGIFLNGVLAVILSAVFV